MIKLGFAAQWVELVMRCVSSVSYSFLINGEIEGDLLPGRGIRQGDPLSPYLFVLCAHGLSELIIDSEQRNLFRGVSIANGCPSISHLFFADDSLIFCRAKMNDCTHMKDCLDIYAKASGQLLNFNKSALSFSPNTPARDKNAICDLFGISQVVGHDIYLGLPTFSMRNKRIQFGYIRDREIEAAYARFWWGSTPEHRRVHWKKWRDLCSPKAMGGMGFKNLSAFNQALLGKQIWRFLQRPNSLVAQVFKAKYFPDSSIWEASAPSTSSYIWKSLLWGRNLVAKGVRWRVGNGNSISVYNSRWVPIPWDFKLVSPRLLQYDATVSCLL
ncbi:hypothetical protein UlMin_004851 [Ulmus minor]